MRHKQLDIHLMLTKGNQILESSQNGLEHYLLVMSPSWNFEGSEPSQAELGHFNFRAETELNRNFLTHFFPKFLLSEVLYHDFNQFYNHLSELLCF